MYIRVLILSLCILSTATALVLQNTIDLSRLQKILQENLKSQDVATLYYAAKGLQQLSIKPTVDCQVFKTATYDSKSVEQVFYLTNAAALTSCQNALKPEVLAVPTQTLDKKDITMAEVYHAVYALKALGKGTIYDKANALDNLIELLKKDDSATNYGYMYQMCLHMGCGSWSTQRVAALLDLADESDGKALYWEGGLPTTSLLLTGILKTYKSLKKPTPLTETHKYKFAEYLVSRNSVSTAKGAALLLDAAMVLAEDTPTPISISIKGRNYITPDTDTIDISISDLIGRPITTLKSDQVIAQSGTRLADDVIVLSKQPLTQKPKEPSVYVLNLNKIKSQYGLYKISLSAGSNSLNVNVAVLGEIVLSNIEIGVGDIDGTTSPRTTLVTYPNKLGEKVQADNLQKLYLKFSVRDKSNKPVIVQQAFVRIGRGDSDEETIFVAEPDNTKTYKVDLSVAVLSKIFKQVSGQYSVNVYLGDHTISNPINWSIGDVVLNFGKDPSPEANAKATNRILPEISHMFRSPEPRPARALSDVFALLCAAPLLLLLVMWAHLRVNFGNMPLSLNVPVFHLNLAGFLGLYAVLWLKLTMFETIRYLLPLAVLTFFSGHRLLQSLVRDKTERK